LFCFERDPHGLSHPFQTAKVLRKLFRRVGHRTDQEGSEGATPAGSGSKHLHMLVFGWICRLK